MARRLRLVQGLGAGALLSLSLAACRLDHAPEAAPPPPPPVESPRPTAPSPDESVEPPIRVETKTSVVVRREPHKGSKRRGLLPDCAVVEVVEHRTGEGCEEPWGRLSDGGWICLGLTEPTDLPLPTEHPLLAFDHPTPDELAEYRRTGEFDRTPGPRAEALLPYVYGRRSGRFAARCWADLEAAQRGDPPVGALDTGRRFHFVDVVETDEGTWLTLRDGRVVPVDEVALFAPTRFAGVDLVATPGPPRTAPAWVRRGGGRLRAEPSLQATVVRELEARTLLHVGSPQAEAGGRSWLPVLQDGGVAGYVAASRLRRLRPLPPPDGVGEDLWIDVDLGQQVLALRRGAALEYATLVSTGVTPGDATPMGLYRVYDKMLHWDMASRPDADVADAYHVEEVPWVMHFWPRYALHGAFWHDGFGEPRSHGCVNLAPRDAREVFERIGPRVPPGWHSAWERPQEPGALLRIRGTRADVPDRRRPLR